MISLVHTTCFQDYLFKRCCKCKNPWAQIWIWIRIGLIGSSNDWNKIPDSPTIVFCAQCLPPAPPPPPTAGNRLACPCFMYMLQWELLCFYRRINAFIWKQAIFPVMHPWLKLGKSELSLKLLCRSQGKVYWVGWGGRSFQKTEQEHINLESAMTMLSIMWTKRKDNARRGYAEEMRRESHSYSTVWVYFIPGLCCTPTIYFHPKFMLSIDLLLLILLLAVLAESLKCHTLWISKNTVHCLPFYNHT